MDIKSFLKERELKAYSQALEIGDESEQRHWERVAKSRNKVRSGKKESQWKRVI